EADIQPRRHRLDFLGAQLVARLLIGHPADGVLALLDLLQIRLVRGAVLRLVFHIADDDRVQRADRLAETQRQLQIADKRDAIPAQVRRERQRHPGLTAAQAAAPLVCDGEVHESALLLYPDSRILNRKTIRKAGGPTSSHGPRAFT